MPALCSYAENLNVGFQSVILELLQKDEFRSCSHYCAVSSRSVKRGEAVNQKKKKEVEK